VNAPVGIGLDALAIEKVFLTCFAVNFKTRLVGGAKEPFYRPAAPGTHAEIHYRSDYSRSALHEVAHWCIAGPRRRRLEDYGYWYSADNRNLTQQQAFFCVEAKPQALESFFCAAAGVAFNLSIDNLSLELTQDTLDQFQASVSREQSWLFDKGLPLRATCFAQALRQARQ
jgi:elongation factor P hydroxylase